MDRLRWWIWWDAYLHGKQPDMEKLLDVRLEKPDGTAIEVNGKSSTSDPKAKTIVLNTREAPPPDTVLVLLVLTDKAKVSVPVELKEVALP